MGDAYALDVPGRPAMFFRRGRGYRLGERLRLDTGRLDSAVERQDGALACGKHSGAAYSGKAFNHRPGACSYARTGESGARRAAVAGNLYRESETVNGDA